MVVRDPRAQRMLALCQLQRENCSATKHTWYPEYNQTMRHNRKRLTKITCSGDVLRAELSA